MADLLDELGGKSSERIGGNVRRIGGDLLDEAGIKSNNYEMLSQGLTDKQANDEHMKILDQINNDMSGFQKFLVGAGRGMTTVARGLGLAEPEDPLTKKAFERPSNDTLATHAGELIGESAPFLAAAPLAGAGLATSAGKVIIPAAKTLAGKIVGSTILGAAQGGTLANGKGGDAVETLAAAGVGGAVAGGIEAIIPVLGKLGRAVFSRLGREPKGPLLTPEGTPTPELQKALKDTGTSFDDLTKNAFALVNKQGVDPNQAVRAARFADQGIPATAGDITQDFSKQATEQRLLQQAGNEASDPLRQMKLNQSETFKSKVNELVDSLGVPSDVGDSVKAALEGRKKLLQSQKNTLYKQVANTAPDVANIPLFTDTLSASMPDKQQLRRLSRLAGSQIDAVNDLMVEFGINKSDDAVKAFAKSGGEITPLNIGNLEDFRSAINQIERADSTGAAKVVTGPLKSALDEEADIVSKSIGDKATGNVLDTLKQARQTVRTIKTEFSPESITGRLIGVKRDGVTPVIESSKVIKELLKNGDSGIETLQRTMQSLRSSGASGQKAISDLQASTVLHALDASLRSTSRKVNGIETVGGDQFAKALNNLGDDKLQEIFKGNEKMLSRLMNLKQTALDMSPAAAATPKGSAPVILDILNRAGSLPGLAAFRDAVNYIVKAGSDERAVRRAMNAKPAYKQVISTFERDFPAIASAIGVSAIVPKITEDQK